MAKLDEIAARFLWVAHLLIFLGLAAIAWMAADNMSRVRSGVWTVADLTSLLADTHLTAANQFMTTLSYELAAQSIHASTNPLLTQDIKAAWVAKLTEHFYLVP